MSIITLMCEIRRGFITVLRQAVSTLARCIIQTEAHLQRRRKASPDDDASCASGYSSWTTIIRSGSSGFYCATWHINASTSARTVSCPKSHKSNERTNERNNLAAVERRLIMQPAHLLLPMIAVLYQIQGRSQALAWGASAHPPN